MKFQIDQIIGSRSKIYHKFRDNELKGKKSRLYTSDQDDELTSYIVKVLYKF